MGVERKSERERQKERETLEYGVLVETGREMSSIGSLLKTER